MSTPTKSKQRAIPSSPTTQNGRVFTYSDELRLLKTFQKFSKSIPSSSSPSPSTPIIVDSQTFNSINKALNSKFTHSQITDKLRRLRIKYRKQTRSKSLIKTPHDQKSFKIARQIWGKKVEAEGNRVQECRSSDEKEEEEGDEAVVEVEGNEEQEREEVNLEDYPVLVSEFSKYLPLNLVFSEALKSLGNGKLKEMNEKWMMIGIEEAKIVCKKAELVKEQTNMIMHVLGGGRNGN